eukprot:2040302-Alexandrium_andersonii.AAC.1
MSPLVARWKVFGCCRVPHSGVSPCLRCRAVDWSLAAATDARWPLHDVYLAWLPHTRSTAACMVFGTGA